VTFSSAIFGGPGKSWFFPNGSLLMLIAHGFWSLLYIVKIQGGRPPVLEGCTERLASPLCSGFRDSRSPVYPKGRHIQASVRAVPEHPWFRYIALSSMVPKPARLRPTVAGQLYLTWQCCPFHVAAEPSIARVAISSRDSVALSHISPLVMYWRSVLKIHSV
jgi:hypothetical protein